jgi:hypothetical protein
MIKLKLSPSKIEKFRQWNEGEYKRDEADNDVITRQMVIDSITGKETWTEKASFGSAFHAVIEHGAEKYKREDGLYHIQESGMPEPMVLQWSEIELADLYHKANPKIIWEVPYTFTHILDNTYHVKIRMRMDGMIGEVLKEHKTTSNTMVNYDFFSRSIQWRCYLIGTQARCVTYERFLYKEPANKPREVSHNSFNFYPDDEMIHILNNNIRRLINFCENTKDEEGKSLMRYIIDNG